jgi:hypothetical protein
MSAVIRFNTKRFDVARERPNPINPIFGESLLQWLKTALAPRYELSEPEPEDWGWYSHLDWNAQKVMLGASASEEANGQREWLLQVVAKRTLKDRLFGRGKVTQDHPLVEHLVRVLSQEPSFTEVTVEGEA